MFLENLNNLSLNCFSISLKPVYFSQGNGKIQDSTWVQFPIQCKNFSLHISKMIILANHYCSSKSGCKAISTYIESVTTHSSFDFNK